MFGTEQPQVPWKWYPLDGRARAGGSRHRDEFVLKGPAVMVERPRPIADIYMIHVRFSDLVQPDGCEASRALLTPEKCPREDVTGTSGKERLVIALPGQELIFTLGRRARVSRGRIVGHRAS